MKSKKKKKREQEIGKLQRECFIFIFFFSLKRIINQLWEQHFYVRLHYLRFARLIVESMGNSVLAKSKLRKLYAIENTESEILIFKH